MARRMKEIEHEADLITHQTIEMLHKTFVTPFDREQILHLITRMDDVLDSIDAAAEALWLYEIDEPLASSKEIAKTLRLATEQVREAVLAMRNMKKNVKRIKEISIEINRLENATDAVLRTAIAKLFKESKDPLFVMKWKEIYEDLENATDRCEDVANIIEGVVLESA
jgi:hypothetical protein